jgi:hypothetical protein
MQVILETAVPSVVVFTTLFGLLARGNPRPGGVALFWRVGLTGLVVGLLGLFAGSKVWEETPAFVVHACWGFVGLGVLCVAFAAFGSVLKKQ